MVGIEHVVPNFHPLSPSPEWENLLAMRWSPLRLVIPLQGTSYAGITNAAPNSQNGISYPMPQNNLYLGPTVKIIPYRILYPTIFFLSTSC